MPHKDPQRYKEWIMKNRARRRLINKKYRLSDKGKAQRQKYVQENRLKINDQAKLRLRNAAPEVKEKRKKYKAEYNRRPDVKQKNLKYRLEYGKRQYHNDPIKRATILKRNCDKRRIERNEIADAYVKLILSNQGIRHPSPELISLKRKSITLKRLMHEKFKNNTTLSA